MNDKQQLAAMGEHMAGRSMCLAKQVEELQAQCGAQAELLREIAKWILNGDAGDFGAVIRRIDALLAGQVPASAVPEGWQLVPVEPTEEMCEAGANAPLKVRQAEVTWIGGIYRAMLAAAPKPEPTK